MADNVEVDRGEIAILLLGAIVELSDRVEDAPSLLAKQGALLALQRSIQKNRPRILPFVKTVKAEIATRPAIEPPK